ncbi:PepSY-associated TM helix domain-containing protein [Marinobacterium jannaschii]|uniref:PepSY-associated TM helix domain-containing protein n=1 Tax=Marinobacterium jannaschii TaxID=64970 RepID=UPI000684D61B|nr:PepSY-associated TM helix domain-containing protein [Marinobacterium jannaschii]
MHPKQWLRLHTWAGMVLGSLLLLVCLSGTLATLSFEIEYLLDKKHRALAPRQGQTDFAALQRSLEQQYPGSQVKSVYLHPADYLAGEVWLTTTDEPFRYIYFDANTGQLLGEGGWGRVRRFLRNLHMNLSLGNGGKWLVTGLSLLLLISLVSSFSVYQKWWRQFLRKPRSLKLWQRGSWSDWHKLVGVWGWWFSALIMLTGLWYLAEKVLQTATVAHYPTAPAVIALETDQRPGLGAIASIARQALPGLDVTTIQYPARGDQAIRVYGQRGDLLVRDRASRVYLHPASGEVLQVQTAADLSLLSRIVDTADPLHFGNFAGLGVKLLWALGGLALSFMVAAGLWMSWLRVRRKRPTVRRWLGTSGSFALILSLLAIVLTCLTFQQGPEKAPLYSPVLATSPPAAMPSLMPRPEQPEA